MQKRSIALLSLALGLGVPEGASATNGMRMIGFGAAQNAMGGVSAGLALDANTVITNPAGMTDLSGRVDFGAAWFVPSVSFKASEIALPAGYAGALVERSGQSFDSQRGGSPIPALGLVLPIGDKLRFGIGAYGVAGMGVDYAQNLYGGTTTTSYSQMRFVPGLAYKVNDLLSVGAVVNVMYAQMDWGVGAGFGQVPHVAGTSIGIGATVGLRLRPHKMLTIGLAYETESAFQNFKFQIPRHQVPNPANPSQPITMAAGQDELSFNQPQALTLGFGLRPTKALTLGLDLQYIAWASTNGRGLPKFANVSPMGGSTNGSMAWDMSWGDQLVLKVGAQYEPTERLALRIGYNYGANPLSSARAFESIAFPAIAEHHVTFGVGVKATDKLFVNVAGMYVPTATLSGANAGNPFAGQGQGLASFETKMSQWAVEAGVGFQF